MRQTFHGYLSVKCEGNATATVTILPFLLDHLEAHGLHVTDLILQKEASRGCASLAV